MSIDLPRLQRDTPISADDGTPALAFHIWWDKFAKSIENALNDLATQQTAITAAQANADAAIKELNRITSYPSSGSILSATSNTTTATITIAAHTRIYPVKGSYAIPNVSITGNSIAGLALSTKYFIYYDDTTLANTTPTFVATTNATTAQVGAAAGRHCIGYITTPAASSTSTGSGGGTPGGTGGGTGPGGGGSLP